MVKQIDINGLAEFKKKCDETYAKVGQGGGSYLYGISGASLNIKGQTIEVGVYLNGAKDLLDFIAGQMYNKSFGEMMENWELYRSAFVAMFPQLSLFGVNLFFTTGSEFFACHYFYLDENANSAMMYAILKGEIVAIDIIHAFDNSTAQRVE